MRTEKFREKKRYVSFSVAAIVVTVIYICFMKTVNLSTYKVHLWFPRGMVFWLRVYSKVWDGEVVRWWGGGGGINDKAEPGKWSLKWSTHPELVTWISERMYHIDLGQFYEKKTQIPRTDVSYAKCHYQSTETGLLDLWHFPLFICTWDLYYWNWKPLQVSLCPDQDYSL